MLPSTSWVTAEGSRRREKQPEVSCSMSVSCTVEGSHRYVLAGYSQAKGMGVGKFLSSEVFSVGGLRWAIHFYPDGLGPEDNGGYVSLFVTLVTGEPDCRALFDLAMTDQRGKVRYKRDTISSRFEPVNLKGNGWSWGSIRFIKKAALERSNFLQNDSLFFECAISVVKTRTVTPIQWSIPVPTSDLGRSLGELLRTEMGSDIVFVVAGESFKAHKLILAARSPVFRAQFFGGIGDPNLDKVDVEEIEPPVFKAMLQFIYSDGFPDVQELAMSIPMCNPTIFLRHLLAAADRYWLDRLKRFCELKLSEEITEDTVADNLALAERHRCPGLKAAGLEFIDRCLKGGCSCLSVRS
ncbi:unnamed protein product [Spirodela intermedia]|uniref:Uncharacterized protein n=1 Tax=Spirodela intermedia TaxID=51605 RepID=A0A7I8K5R0_SPIIN|nr:unnamed protein product [Spirodela intermedia]